jgi:hypothetical protein
MIDRLATSDPVGHRECRGSGELGAAGNARRAAPGAKRGLWAMTPQESKVRMVLAVLEGREAFWGAIGALVAQGILIDHLAVIALDTTIARLASVVPAEPPGLLHMITATEVLSDASQPGPVRATPMLVGLWRSGIPLPALWADGHQRQSTPRLGELLGPWIASGAAVIAVAAVSAEQQWIVTRILLGRSSCPVQTVEHSIGADDRLGD